MARAAVTGGRLSKIEGVQEMLDKIAGIMDRTTAEQLIAQVFMPAGRALQHEIKVSAPYRDWGKRQILKSGGEWPHLRDSVFLTKGRATAPNVIVGISHRTAPQGIWVEYGTVHAPAYPFFRSAVSRSRDHVMYILITGIDALIQNTEA